MQMGRGYNLQSIFCGFTQPPFQIVQQCLSSFNFFFQKLFELKIIKKETTISIVFTIAL